MSHHGYGNNSYDVNENDRVGPNICGSDEDTEEASETEFSNRNRGSGERIEIREQMYQEKLAILNKEVEELKSNRHPECIKRIKELEDQYKDRLRKNEIHRDYLRERAEKDYILEKKAAFKEYKEKKADLKDNILRNLEKKKKLIEYERHSLKLTSGSPRVTRKLSGRQNEHIPVVEKRHKPAEAQSLVFLLEDKDIDSDLKTISGRKPLTPTSSQNGVASLMNNTTGVMIPGTSSSFVETRIENGKLLYERRWFHRGQPVYVEGKELLKFAATISAIGNEIVCVKKVKDNNCVKISMTDLAKGKILIKQRAN